MKVVVVDASALAAVIFDEPEAPPIVAATRGRLIAPTLIRYELASVCLIKTIRYPDRAEEFEARHRLTRVLALDLFEPDWDMLPPFARRFQLSVYDAAYLQLAIARAAPLVTLDARLAAAWDDASHAR